MVARRKSTWAMVQQAARQAEAERRRREAANHRAFLAAQREAERSAKASERAAARAALLSAKERAAAEREALRLHQESRQSEVDALNAELAGQYEALDGLLAATLAVDDYVDLDSLKQVVQHPPFEPGRLGQQAARPTQAWYPAEPVFLPPAPPTGVAAAFGGKKKHEQAVQAAQQEFAQIHAQWVAHCQSMAEEHRQDVARWEANEAERQEKLAKLEQEYAQKCAEREAEVERSNADLEKLKNDLAFDLPEAIEEYVQIVLANSAYPPCLPVESSAMFDLSIRELAVRVALPAPETLPTVKEYRYKKTGDEITSTQLTAKAQKDRYASVVHQVAVRTLHEIFEADRAEKIRSIALEVFVSRMSPATGLPEDVSLVQVATAREEFATFDLANVDPAATLAHLGAVVSKNPHGLVPANTSAGVRKRAGS